MQSFGHREFIVSQDERYRYIEIYKQSLQVAHWLSTRFQVRKGDRGKHLLLASTLNPTDQVLLPLRPTSRDSSS